MGAPERKMSFLGVVVKVVIWGKIGGGALGPPICPKKWIFVGYMHELLAGCERGLFSRQLMVSCCLEMEREGWGSNFSEAEMADVPSLRLHPLFARSFVDDKCHLCAFLDSCSDIYPW